MEGSGLTGPARAKNGYTMNMRSAIDVGLIIALLVIWLVLAILGFAVKGLLWLAIAGLVLFAVTGIVGWTRGRGSIRS